MAYAIAHSMFDSTVDGIFESLPAGDVLAIR